MSDGRWTAPGIEQIRQGGLVRERPLRVNTGAPTVGVDASGYAASRPDAFGIPDDQRGPHFILSPESPDGRPTLGFEFTLDLPTNGGGAVAGAGGFSVTVWKLITNAQSGISPGVMPNPTPLYAAFATLTGVGQKELYHSFDINAAALRFQIVPDYTGGGADGAVMIWFNEL